MKSESSCIVPTKVAAVAGSSDGHRLDAVADRELHITIRRCHERRLFVVWADFLKPRSGVSRGVDRGDKIREQSGRIRARSRILEPQLEHAAHGRFDGRGGQKPSWPMGDRSGPPTAPRCAVGVRYPWRHSWRLSAPYRHTVGACAYTTDFHPFAALRSTRCVSTDSARCAVGTWPIRATAQGRYRIRGL